MPRITSNAKWTKVGNSYDVHNLHDNDEDNIECAEAICSLLLDNYNEYSPCEIRGICLGAWVEIDGVKVSSNT